MLPLFVALIALATRRWYPVLDLAMTELRLRDVGKRQTPLIGLPGRIGTFPDQGSHPGPLSFWLLAPGHRLFGSSAWAMEAATVLLHTMWVALALWIGQRRLGRLGLVVVAAAVVVLVRGYGLTVLVQPWNPYLPLLAWIVVLLAVWSVFVGDDLMLIPLTLAATFVAQTHIPYLPLAGSLGIVAAGVVIVRFARDRQRPSARLAFGVSAGVFAVAWLGPLVDQLRRDPGNIARLIDHFTAPSDDTLGLAGGIELLLRHLDLAGAFGGLLTGTGSFLDAGFDPDGAIWPGILVFAAWVIAFAVSIRSDRRGSAGTSGWSPLTMLHVVIAITLVLSLASMSSIFGKTWYYLTLWAWGTTTLLLVAIVWTAWTWLRDRRRVPWCNRRVAELSALGLGVVLTIATVAVAPSTDHPEERVGEPLGSLVEPTARALRDGVGAATGESGRYVVRWTDAAFFGSQGYGLVSELERVGLDAGVYETWSVPVTAHRVIPAEQTTAEVILATGRFVDEWRNDPRVVEVAEVDLRTAAELQEFSDVRQELLDDLRAEGLDDLESFVDSNLFGLLVDSRVSVRGQFLVDRLLLLGQQVAVFVGPPGVAP